MRCETEPTKTPAATSLPSLRFEIPEAAGILRMSRAQLYIRIQQGAIRVQKDGSRTYVSMMELERYVQACEAAHSNRNLEQL
jgi:hypothetical protein